jgi:hypothetical protein
MQRAVLLSYYRKLLPPQLLKADMQSAIKQALEYSRKPAAARLPGYKRH